MIDNRETQKQKFFNKPNHTGLLRDIQIKTSSTKFGEMFYLQILIDIYFRNQKFPKLCCAYGILAKDIIQRINEGILVKGQEVEVSGRHIKPPYSIDENSVGLSNLGILYLSKLDGIAFHDGSLSTKIHTPKKRKCRRRR